MHAYYVPDTILETVHAVEKNKTKTVQLCACGLHCKKGDQC